MADYTNIDKEAERRAKIAKAEAEYRLGIYTDKEIAERAGVAVSTIRTWKTKHGWAKTLKDKVADRAKEKIASGDQKFASEEELIEAAAAEAAEVVGTHKKTLKRIEGGVNSLLSRLEEQVSREQIVVETNEGPVEIDLPLEYLSRVLDRASVSYERVVKLQRQTYGLDDPTDPDDKEDRLTEAEIDAKIARLLGESGA